MKISASNNNISFQSNPLYKLNVKSADNKLVKAVFSELDPFSYKDAHIMQEIKAGWKNRSDICDLFCEDFTDSPSPKYTYNAIELPEKASIKDKFAGFLQTSSVFGIIKSKLHINFIVTNPQYANMNKSRELKDIGENLLGEAFFKAKQQNVSFIDFTSEADGFYQNVFKQANIKYGITDDCRYHVESSEFDKMINYCEQKFGFKHSTKNKLNQVA